MMHEGSRGPVELEGAIHVDAQPRFFGRRTYLIKE